MTEQTSIQKITQQFVIEHKRPGDIAQDLGLEITQVQEAIEQNKLAKKRQEYIDSVYREAQQEYKLFIAETRPSVLAAQSRAISTIQNKLQTILENTDPDAARADTKIERLSRALKNITDVSSRLVSVSDKPFNDTGNTGAKNSFLVVNVRPSAPENNSVRDITNEIEVH